MNHIGIIRRLFGPKNRCFLQQQHLSAFSFSSSTSFSFNFNFNCSNQNQNIFKIPHLYSQNSINSSFNYVQVRHAGHNKWSNIKHVKGANDAKKAKLMNMLARDARFAVQSSGGVTDLKLNKKLADIFQEAKNNSLPLANLQKIVDQMKGGKNSDLKSGVFPMRGPGGCFILAEACSSNLIRTKQEISAVIKKFGTKHADDNILFHFKYQGTILCSDFKGKPVKPEQLDDALAHAIEAGAEEVTFIESEEFGPTFEFISDAQAYLNVSKELETLGYSIAYCEAEYLPTLLQELGESEVQMISNLYEKLRDKEDIVRLYDNVVSN